MAPLFVARLQKMWDRVKTWILLHAYLSDDKCTVKVETPMGWIMKCRHRFITYYEIVPREIRCPIDDVDSVMFEVAYVEGLLPAIQMCAGFKLVLAKSGLYMYTRDMADIVVSKDVTDLAAYVSAKIEHYVVARDKQKYRERRRAELKAKYNYAVLA
jgi:hypothetical protein